LVLAVALHLGSGCDNALAVPTDAGPDSALQLGDQKPGSVSGDACREIKEDGLCDAQLACHTLRSGDMPCDNASCTDHFVACLPGPAVCTRPASTSGCKMLLPSCRTGDTLDYADGVCPDGCVSRSKCPKADPGG
jgi:hypothetical protein